MHGLGGDGAVGAFFVDHDADDLDVVGRINLLQHFFRVGHLRHGLGRDERHGVNALEPGADQRAQVGSLDLGRDLAREALPGVAGTFD